MVERTQPCVATWCPICDKRVSDKGKDTDRLLGHVRRNHRKICDQRSEKKENIERPLDRRSSNVTRLTSLSCGKKKDRKRVYATRGKVNANAYATVDTWKSHDERKICPQCQREAVPALHTRRDNLTTSHMAAICLLGCWPFCFIPLMKRSRKVRMICPSCGYVYGTYEYNNNGLIPCQEDDSEIMRVRLPSSTTSFRKAHVCNPTKVECDLPRNDAKRSLWITDKEGFSKRIWLFGGNKKKRSVYSTRVETWRYHDESYLCPVCKEEALPIVFTKRHKFSSSRLGVTCLLGCWPLCFVPLMLSRERQVRLVCPFCGHNYGNRVYEMKSKEANESEEKLTNDVVEKRDLRESSKLAVRTWQKSWERMFNDSKQVQDVSQQTEKTDGKMEKEIEEEEERRRRGASGPGAFQYPPGETTSRCSEACTFCSKQVTLEPRYETHPKLTDLDYDDDTDFVDMCHTRTDRVTDRWDSDFYSGP